MDEIIFKQEELTRQSELYILNTIKTIKELEEREKELKTALFDEMTKRGIKEIKNETLGLTISIIPETTRETFETKRFRADNPDLYDEYCKISPVKGYTKITVKE